METRNWCQKFEIDQDLNEVILFSQEQMAKYPFMTQKDHSVLGQKSRYWDWYTRDLQNPAVLRLLQTIQIRHGLPVNTMKTRFALWEYGEGDLLPPHVDSNVSLSSAVIISLIGRFETHLYDECDNYQILDKVTYGPGEYIVLNNTVYCHGGRPLDAYRLALVAFVDPSFNMTHFWR